MRSQNRRCNWFAGGLNGLCNGAFRVEFSGDVWDLERRAIRALLSGGPILGFEEQLCIQRLRGRPARNITKYTVMAVVLGRIS